MLEIMLQALVAVFFVGSLVLGFTGSPVHAIRIGTVALGIQGGLTALQWHEGARTVAWNVLIAALLAVNVALDVRALHRKTS